MWSWALKLSTRILDLGQPHERNAQLLSWREMTGGIALRFMRMAEMNERTEQALLDIGIEKFAPGRLVTEPVARLSAASGSRLPLAALSILERRC